MNISDFGLSFIANEEGFVDHIYLDQVKRPTIGYGHLVQPGERFPARITREQGLALFRRDLATFEKAVEQLITYPLRQKQFDVLVSLAFNIGAGGLAKSRMRQKLNAGDIGAAVPDAKGALLYTGAMAEWFGFNKGLLDGKVVVLDVLVKRRTREIGVFLEEHKRRDVDPATAPDLRDPTLSEVGKDDDIA